MMDEVADLTTEELRGIYDRTDTDAIIVTELIRRLEAERSARNASDRRNQEVQAALKEAGLIWRFGKIWPEGTPLGTMVDSTGRIKERA